MPNKLIHLNLTKEDKAALLAIAKQFNCRPAYGPKRYSINTLATMIARGEILVRRVANRERRYNYKGRPPADGREWRFDETERKWKPVRRRKHKAE